MVNVDLIPRRAERQYGDARIERFELANDRALAVEVPGVGRLRIVGEDAAVEDIAEVAGEIGHRHRLGELIRCIATAGEHAVDELVGGSADGLRLFESMRATVEAGGV